MIIPEIKNDDGSIYKDFTFFKKGGMGEIYKGIEVNTGEEIILKLVVIATPEEESLLITEFDAIDNFSHKNIAETLQTGKMVIADSEYLFMIQKYYPEGNLRSQIRENIPTEQCFDMMLDILNGMKEIHQKYVHRDLKPENILVDSDGSLLITDFGLAKYIDEKTRTKSFKGWGTIPYMAPECWTGETNTISMDIYSLGVIFYEILTGGFPYSATTELEWKDCHLFEPFPSISTKRKDLTVKVDQIIQKMANKRVKLRYKSIDEIVDALLEAKSINDASNKDAERLAQMGNITLQNQKEQALKAQREAEKTAEWIKFLNFEITELFNTVLSKVSAINERLEDGKIEVKEQESNSSTQRKLTLTFRGRSITISFSHHNAIDNNNEQLKADVQRWQGQEYGRMVMGRPQDSYFKTNNFILLGLAETTFKVGNIEYGFNLLLKKLDGSNYGEWYFVQFSRNCQPPETSFGINLPSFFEEFQKLHHHPYYTTKMQELEDIDFTHLLEKILF